MDDRILELIKSRRSIGKVKAEAPPREMIEKLLEAATWAPNHYRVEPWRFLVLTGEARERLGDVFAQSVKAGYEDQSSAEAERAAQAARSRALRAPYIITVVSEPPKEPSVIEVENICAVSAAVQNMLLLAHSMGLGAYWRTGSFASDPLVKAFFDLEPGSTIVGFIYVGYPDMDPPTVGRTPYSEKTVWMN